MSYVLTKFKTETPDESPPKSPKDPATELQSTSESEPSWMPPVSHPVPNFPSEEPTTDHTTELQYASESEPSLMPLVSYPVPNFPTEESLSAPPTDPTTKLQSKLPNKRSQRAPSSEPSKSSVKKEHGHRRTSPPKQPSKLRSKMILDHPNCFGRVQINLVGSKSFLSGSN
jgi:hypothetical protein